jgi:hypothetical protein
LAAEPDVVTVDELPAETATEVVASIETEAAAVVDEAVAPAEVLPTVDTEQPAAVEPAPEQQAAASSDDS